MEFNQETATTLTDPAEAPMVATLREAGESIERLNERAMAFARERPLTCIAGAVALGFVIGKLAARYS